MADDEMKMEDITPDDLGCLGEKEIDDGVLEETPEPVKKVSPSFEAIPFDKRKTFRKLYDQFDDKDMPFEEFCIELYAIQSPGLMQHDLGGIIDQKHAGYRRKAAVDFNLTHRN